MDTHVGVIVGTPRMSARLATRRQSLIEKDSLNYQCEQITPSGSGCTDSYIANNNSKEVRPQSPATPRRRRRATCDVNPLNTPTGSSIGAVHTPRRSTRKSIRPAQDYEEIVNSKASRSLKKDILIEEQDDEEQELNKDMRKWTPSKVGRGAVKRKSKRGRRAAAARKCLEDKEVINVDSEVLDVIANDEEENKENVEPEELRKTRKSPKERETKNNSRRSMDVLQVSKLQTHELQNKNESTCVEFSDNGEEKIEREEFQGANDKQLSLSPKRKSESFQLEEFGLVPMEAEENGDVEQKIEDREGENETNSNLSSTKIDETIIVSPAENEVLQKSPGADNPVITTIVLDTTQSSIVLDDQREVEVKENDGIADKISDEVEDSGVVNVQDSQLNTSDCILISPLFEIDSHLVDKANNKKSDEEVVEVVNSELDKKAIVETIVISPMEDCNISEQQQSGHQKENRTEVPRIALNSKLLCGLDTPKPMKKISIITPMVKSVKESTSRPNRVPTPYKPKLTNLESGTSMGGDNNATLHSLSSFNLTTEEPKDFILRSIRKRSFSASIDRSKKKPPHRVKFNSPANQTTIIDDIDLLISKSTKKRDDLRKQDTSNLDTSNVTKRRKRSLSVDESFFSKRGRGPVTPLKGAGGTTPQRLQAATRIPNFAAIHQRQFNRMENLVDHVARKADRAKQLLNSASKPRSAQKASTSTEQNLKAKTSGTSAVNASKPRAIKQFDLTGCITKPMITSKNVERLQCPNEDGLIDDDNSSNSTICNLPDPRMFKNIAIIQPVAVSKPAKSNTLKNVPKVFKPLPKNPHHSKPPFNLSTHINNLEAATTASNLEKSNDKILERRHRHMGMFKGRIGCNKEKEKSSGEIIQGVRSNRRFDLQMQHRKNLMQDHAKP